MRSDVLSLIKQLGYRLLQMDALISLVIFDTEIYFYRYISFVSVHCL